MSSTHTLEYPESQRRSPNLRPRGYRCNATDLYRAGAIIGTLAAGLTMIASVAEAETIEPLAGLGTDGEGRVATSGFENPFNYTGLGVIYQQVWNGNLFATEPVEITGVNLRLDGAASAFAGTLPAVEIYMSTTASTGATFSDAYSANRGTDFVQTFSGSVDIDATAPGPAPNPFDFALPFTTAFDFDPAFGNLLLEFRVSTGNTALGALDWEEFGTDQPPTSSLFGIYFGTPPADGANGTVRSGEGLIVQFTTAAAGDTPSGDDDNPTIPGVPLPGSLPLALLSLGGLGLLRFGTRRDAAGA